MKKVHSFGQTEYNVHFYAIFSDLKGIIPFLFYGNRVDGFLDLLANKIT